MLNRFFITRESEVRFFSILAIALVFLFVISLLMGTKIERGDHSAPTETASGVFPSISIEAKSAYVYDPRTETVLFAKEENVRRPLASITKVMSALVAVELAPSYGTVTIGSEALKVEGDSGLHSGERWSLKDLLDFSLISSSNDGIHAVALALGALNRSEASEKEIMQDFVSMMNQKALELDLNNTYFWNDTGLDETELKGGAYGTAKDIATLMEYVVRYHPDVLEATRESSLELVSLDDFKYEANNTNKITGEIPGLIASKTGFTDTAGGNLTFVFDPELGRPIIVSILGSSAEGRFEDAKKLVAGTLEYLNGAED